LSELPPEYASQRDNPAVIRPPQLGSARAASVPAVLGGCFVRRELGRRTIGPVYLARQLDSNRDVALEVMRPQWALGPTFVARFAREAFAAAQLSHHNIAAIDEFGEDKGRPYWITEFVGEQSLGSLVRDNQPLEVDQAVGYVLQAARGLKCAHDQNMFHRDLSPKVLFLDRRGLVKVADVGLAKTPEAAEAEERAAGGKPADSMARAGGGASGASQLTPSSISIESPGFMAPELATNPGAAGRRSDIYSLGCVLYFLATGRPLIEGRSVLEILEQQQTQPSVPADELKTHMPKALAAIVVKMTARKPEDRYPDMGDVIRTLEEFAGISSSGPTSASEENARLLQASAISWHDSPSARLRSRVTAAILAGCLGLALLCVLPGWWLAAMAFFSLGLFTALADFAVVGLRRQTPLFQRVCALVLGNSLSEWLTVLASLALLTGLLVVLKLFWISLALLLAAIGIALGLRALDLHAEAERRGPLELVETIVRSMRRQGHDEDVVRQFVCTASGGHWEELYESLFGYESKLMAREHLRANAGTDARPAYARWRDPIIGWIDGRLAARRERRELAVLQKFEERALVSQGVNLVTARRKANRAARAMIVTAAEIRETIRPRAGTIVVNRSIGEAMREAAVNAEAVLLEHEHGVLHEPHDGRDRGRRLANIASIVVGPKIRFLAGLALLAGCIAWMHQNALISAEHASALVEAAKAGDLTGIQSHAQAGVAHAAVQSARKTEMLALPGIPRTILALVSSFGAGAGGLFLIVSSFVRGVRIALFAVPAAAIPILGPRLGLPPLLGLDPSFIPSILGAAVLAAGLVLGRESK
jgi:eukaryotic-like serine/threonine-protein kinase